MAVRRLRAALLCWQAAGAGGRRLAASRRVVIQDCQTGKLTSPL